MNQKLLFWLLLGLVLTGGDVFGENIEVCWPCAQDEYERGEFQRASLSYEFIYMHQTSDSSRAEALSKKLDCLLLLNNESEIRRCFNRLRLFEKRASIEDNLSIKEALFFMKLDELDFAEFKLSTISENSIDSSLYFDYWMARYALYLHQEDQENAQLIYSTYIDPEQKNLELISLLNKKRLFKSTKKAKTLSTIFPGLGQIYAGRPDQALINMLLVGGFGLYAVVSFASGYIVTGVLTGIPFMLKFYLGGRENAENLVRRKNASNKNHLVNYISVTKN